MIAMNSGLLLLMIPQGSMYPNSGYFDRKVVPIWVLWGQSIYYLGTWTLRDREPRGIVLMRVFG